MHLSGAYALLMTFAIITISEFSMPKFTKTGYEISSSEAPIIVLGKNKFGDTRQKKLDEFRKIRAGVEILRTTPRNIKALRRGTHLEHSVATWAKEELEILTDGKVDMFEPTDAYRDKQLLIGASIDRIITLEKELHLGDYVLDGEGICEIKTDFYHEGYCRQEWIIQVQHQMLCSGHDWGIVACMDQKGKLHFYPLPRDNQLVTQMFTAYDIFWNFIDNDMDYPLLVDKDEPEYVDIKEKLPDTNIDFLTMCNNYLKASAEESEWKKVKEDIKEAIVMTLDGLGIERATINNFKIKSETVQRERKEQVGTGIMYDSTSFSLKEISNE
jgi:predicted phage-related endonuclease